MAADRVSGQPAATVGANVTTYADSSLASGTTYEYRVRAQTASVYGAYTEIVSAKTW